MIHQLKVELQVKMREREREREREVTLLGENVRENSKFIENKVTRKSAKKRKSNKQSRVLTQKFINLE